MEIFSNIALGMETAVSPFNLFYCLIGCLVGTLVGVLPGIGPTATIALLLPLTYQLDPIGALIMLAGIYYGAQYGGSTTSILVKLPGQPESVVTAIDGYEMAKQGRGGIALATSAYGSFFAGTAGTLLIAFFAPILTEFALQIRPADNFSLMLLALVVSIAVAHGSIVKAGGMLLLGALIGTVGTDVNEGMHRYTFGIMNLYDGVDIVVLVMGLFGVAETIRALETHMSGKIAVEKITSLMPTKKDIRDMANPIVRGTGIGAVLGLLPGGGALLASFASYALEKRVSKTPEQFGKGAIAGVAGPESANNAAAQTSFIPMLTLGIPANVVMAMMMSVMIMRGITPGPSVIAEQPALVWALVASMWIGNAMLLALNLPLIGMWVKIVRIPYELMYPAILILCVIGVYSLNNSVFDLYVMIVAGALGYLALRLGCELAPFVLGMLLGPLLEVNMQRALLLSRGDPLVFFQRPMSLVCLIMAVLILVANVLPSVRRTRDEVMIE
jgi:TctA family transporter